MKLDQPVSLQQGGGLPDDEEKTRIGADDEQLTKHERERTPEEQTRWK